MSQSSQGFNGQVVPFKRSSGYVHKKAMENRRGLHYLEAVELYRRALEQAPENEEIQLDLAETLSEMECFEESNRLLLRILSANMWAGEAYYGLAVNYYALQQREEAADALANYLHLCPDGPYWEDAQDMLDTLSFMEDEPEPYRQELMFRRGVAALARDQGDKALRLLKRALKIARNKARAHSVLSMAYLTRGDMDKAFYHAKMALAGDQGNVQARCALCLILQKMGKNRAAMGFLRKTEALCQSPADERMFLRAAQELGGKDLARHFLSMQAKVSPYRIATLHQLAAAYYAMNETGKAENLWVRILRIDAENVQAAAYLKILRGGGSLDPEVVQAGALPKEEAVSRLTAIAAALAGGPESWREAWNQSDSLYQMVRWGFTLPDEKLHGALLNGVYQAARAGGDQGRAAGLIRELLTAPEVPEETRRRAVLLLCDLNYPTPYLMVYQKKLTQVTCAPEQSGDPAAWRVFLKMFLIETRSLGKSREAAFFAAQRWKRLDRAHRARAAGEEAYAWVLAMEALFLRSISREDLVMKLVNRMPISLRRVQRAMNVLYDCLPPAQDDEPNACKGEKPHEAD